MKDGALVVLLGSFARRAPQLWADVFAANKFLILATTSGKYNDRVPPILQPGWFPSD